MKVKLLITMDIDDELESIDGIISDLKSDLGCIDGANSVTVELIKENK